jgi:gluconate 2-dehydrogenase subunit 3-like protein
MSRHGDLTRRDAFKATLGTVLASKAVHVRAAVAAPVLRFFTPDEFAVADVLSELLIPADEHSGGARAAGVVPYIDQYLAEAFTDEPRREWREGLKQIDDLARRTHGTGFVQLRAGDQAALISALAANERDPKSPEDGFFVQFKRRVVHAYYTSRIGIHDELEYKGNVMLQEFVGVDVSRDG